MAVRENLKFLSRVSFKNESAINPRHIFRTRTDAGYLQKPEFFLMLYTFVKELLIETTAIGSYRSIQV